MTFRALQSRSLAASLAVLLAMPTIAEAHPHIFVDARFEAVAGADGSLSEACDSRHFDEVFSSSVLLDFDKNSNSTLDSGKLAAVAKTAGNLLAKYNYYTNITINGKAISLARPDMVHADYKESSLTLSFRKNRRRRPL